MHRAVWIASAAIALCLLATQPTARAETYNTCAGFIDSVPATITTQGVWCLRKDLATAITSGAAITIATNNVTLDCNGFKIGGLAAGNASVAYGIFAGGRQNATTRNCNIRGFLYGIYLSGGAGHLVEDNRLDNNLFAGMYITGSNSLVQRNRVYDTGGWTGGANAFGILASGQITDNIVSGLFADISGGYLSGIDAWGTGDHIRDNSVSGFDMVAVQGGNVDTAYALNLSSRSQRASGNQVIGNSPATNGVGINTLYIPSFCQDNVVSGFTTNISASCISSGNLVSP